jgi:hypothetical protein
LLLTCRLGSVRGGVGGSVGSGSGTAGGGPELAQADVVHVDFHYDLPEGLLRKRWGQRSRRQASLLLVLVLVVLVPHHRGLGRLEEDRAKREGAARIVESRSQRGYVGNGNSVVQTRRRCGFIFSLSSERVCRRSDRRRRYLFPIFTHVLVLLPPHNLDLAKKYRFL